MAFEQLILTVEHKLNGKKVYRVLRNEVEVVYKSAPTHRDYVCMVGYGNDVAYRFGRLNLIGKGDSRHFFSVENVKRCAKEKITMWKANFFIDL